MGWEYELYQIKDEIEDMAEARTHTKYDHSKSQLKRRIDRLTDDAKRLGGDDKATAELFIHIGTLVYEGKMGEDKGKWAVNNIEAYVEEVNQRALAEIERNSPAARKVRAATGRFETWNTEYDGVTSAAARHRVIELMRRELAVPEVAVALQAARTQMAEKDTKSAKPTGLLARRVTALTPMASAIAGVSNTQWRSFKEAALKAAARVDLWDRTQAANVPTAPPAATFMPMLSIGAARLTPLGIKAGNLSLKIEQYRDDPAGQQGVAMAALDDARASLELDPAGEGADRLREVIAQAEALVLPEEVVPLDIPPQIQESEPPPPPPPSGPNWVLLGGAVVGLAAAVTTTVIVVKKVKGKKKGSK